MATGAMPGNGFSSRPRQWAASPITKIQGSPGIVMSGRTLIRSHKDPGATISASKAIEALSRESDDTGGPIDRHHIVHHHTNVWLRTEEGAQIGRAHV